jgi:hypothetical protein
MTMSMVRKYWGRFAYCACLTVLLGWMVQCGVKLRDRGAWRKTTGQIGIHGTIRNKGSSTVSVSYVDPDTGESETGDMPVPDGSVRALIDRGDRMDQTVYVYDNIFNTRTICVESSFDECLGEATPKLWMYGFVVALLAIGGGYLIRDLRRDRRSG